MVICDIGGNYEVNSIEDLEAVLAKRHSGNTNCFWLAESPGAYPQLEVLVKDNHATLNYLPRGQAAGLRSVGGGTGLDPSGTSIFLIGSLGDRIEVLNDAVIPFPAALEAAKEFLLTQQPPKSVGWLEL